MEQAVKTEQGMSSFTKKIGQTTFRVNVYFAENTTATFEDKLLHLLEKIMEIFKCQEDMLDILENQQYQLEQLKLANQEQQELMEKLNAENRRLSVENRNLIVQNQKLAAQNRQLQELCRE